jgi:hypothetical protein
MAKRIGALIMVLCLVTFMRPLPSEAIFGFADTAVVYDPTNWAENFATALSTAAMVQNQLKDLASLGNLAAFGNVLASTQSLLRHAQRIAGVLKGRNAQWVGLTKMDQFTNADPQDLPELLESWNQRASGLMGICATEAMQAQELLEEIGTTLQDVSAFINGISAMAGTVQGLQTLAGAMSTAASEVMRMTTLAGTFHQAMLNDKLLISVNEQVSGLLARERLKDWPTENPLTSKAN